MDQIDQKALDVGAIGILIRHDHDGAIAQALQLGIILFVEVQPDDFDEVLNFLVGHHLLQRSIAHVEHLSTKWENAPLITSDDAKSGNGQRLGRVALRQNQGTFAGELPTCIIRILQLRDARQSSHATSIGLQFLSQVNFGLGHGGHQDEVHHPTTGDLTEELLRKFTARPKFGLLGRQGLLCLRVKSRILDQTLDEDPNVVSHMVRFHIHTALDLFFALRFHLLQDGLDNLIRHVGHMCPTTDGADRVHETHLIEAALCEAYADFPSVRALLVDLRHTLPGQQVEITVVPEVLDVQFFSIQVDTTLL
mmetsp:Transcript_59322/g.130245  ORF Transcript_59322/g.130245 Transcript_59322/m.130245 type:complete len:308 (+) Transcript_59322:2227-3150(+)